MSLLKILDVSSSAMMAEGQRLNIVASNLANAESVAGPDGQPYKARAAVFQSRPGPAADMPDLRRAPCEGDQSAGRRGPSERHLARGGRRRLHLGRLRRGDLRGGGDRVLRETDHDCGVRETGTSSVLLRPAQ